MLQLTAIRQLAEENGVVLDEEDQAAIGEQLQRDITQACGEGATEEDFNAYLESIYLSRDVYDMMNQISMLYQRGFIQLYGPQGEKMDSQEALDWMVDKGYLSCTHILQMTVDSETGEELEQDAANEKLATAQRLAEELQAIQDPEALVARFRELKEEYCEDTGKAVYPDGYVFLPGTMVPEFEEATLALEDYQVSDPVKTDYGYHVILRLPLDPDALIDYSSGGSPMTGRSYAANDAYARQLQERFEALELEYAEGFSAPNLTEYLQG